MDCVEFTLDNKDRILQVNDSWDLFACDNGAPELCARDICGRSLFDYIVGDATRMFVRVLLDQARVLDKALCRDYRCDSDNLKRYMRMEIIPREKSRLLLNHITLRTEPLTPAVKFVYRNSSSACLRCSDCNRVWTPGDTWLEADQLFSAAETRSPLPTVYTICPDCKARPSSPLILPRDHMRSPDEP